jgi:NAD(P)-dependent dehydrogenase (short-subunit alcohol dehydrogenase family)/catechol 2,3-dioxygenase-like lactoylglutathione lyase family enzyme
VLFLASIVLFRHDSVFYGKGVENVTNTSTKTALITGASRGLGIALARALAREGWNLLLDARGAAALEAARAELSRYTHVVAIAGDVTDPTHRAELARAARQLGGLDALINNASILGPSPQPSLLAYPLESLRAVYETNIIAPLALTQDVRDSLTPHARILNVTSDAGVEPYEGWGGYGSSKAALEQCSAILAAENPEWRVYWVDPGDMRTELHQLAFPGEDISDRPLPETSVPGFLTLLTGDLPSGRYKARELPGCTSTSDSVNETDAHTEADERNIGRMGTQMHQEAFPSEDISDRPLPETSVPGLLTLLAGALPSGRYSARALGDSAERPSSPSADAAPAVRELRVALTVEDFEAAVRLYRDGLRLPVAQEWRSPEGRGMVLAAGPGTIELLDHADSEHTDQIETGKRISGPVRLALRVVDVRATAAALVAHGAEAVHPPVHTTWADFNQRLQAPDGMQLSLFQRDDETQPNEETQ